MSSTNMHTEIVELFEKSQLSEDLIAKELGIEEGVVVATLLQYSSIYKRIHFRLASKETQTEEEKNEYKEHLRALAFCAEDESVRLRALQYLNEEVTGRNDLGLKKLEQDKILAKNTAPNVQNVVIFNAILQKGREERAKLLKNVEISVPQLEESLCTS